VAARRGEQRHVVADALVADAPAHVVDGRPLHLREAPLDEVRASRHDLDRLEVEGPALGIFDDDEGFHSSSTSGSITRKFAS
jgi:hypothetical protein